MLTQLCFTRRGYQDAAVDYALNHLEERTWAVIALDEATDGRVDYTIRMNFTVVPNTNHVVDMIAIGLDPRYVSYCTPRFSSATAFAMHVQLLCEPGQGGLAGYRKEHL